MSSPYSSDRSSTVRSGLRGIDARGSKVSPSAGCGTALGSPSSAACSLMRLLPA